MKRTAVLFFTFLIVGSFAVLFSKTWIGDFSYSNGKELVAFFIPLPLTLIFFYVNSGAAGSARIIVLSLLLFIGLCIPFYDILLTSYQHYPRDDGYRYAIVANNIAKNNTLWGSDDLIFGTNYRVYMVQPGYRYYLAAWIKLFGNENRLYQCVNMFIYGLSVMVLFSRVTQMNVPPLFKKGFALFIILSSPFVAKLIMMCLMEWLVVTLFIWVIYCYLSNRLLLSVILLALVPFMRQNMLFVALFLFGYIFFEKRDFWKYAILFLAILLLPVYHNLYYAGQWKFLSTYNSVEAILSLDFQGPVGVRWVKTFFYHIILYGGIDWLLNNPLANLLAFSCIPVGTLLYLYCIKSTSLAERRWFLLITLSAIVPTLIVGGRAYYPRFEWVNLYFAALIFIIIKSKMSLPGLKQRKISRGDNLI